MYGENNYDTSTPLGDGMPCAEFDALLGDALDGSLEQAQRERFEAHRATCPSCGPRFAEARAGMRWLQALPEVEPPARLVRNILAATSGLEQAAPMRPRESWWQRLGGVLKPRLTPVLQPRFAMSFAMAFFCITLLLNFAGVNASELKHVDLRPSALVRGYYETQGRLVKYYENIRFVYEIESRVQQLKRVTTPEENTAPKSRDRSREPDGKYRNYSRDGGSVVMARLLQQTLEQ